MNKRVEITEITSIEWKNEKDGTITPIIFFKPIKVFGQMIDNMSMHNLTNMKEMLGENPHIGQQLALQVNV